jgi:hypothetical protein
MRTLCSVALLTMLPVFSDALAQESGWAKWTIQPHISLGKLLPGSSIKGASSDFFFTDSRAYAPTMTQYQYAGTALGFGFRAFPAEHPWLAVVLGGGIRWFYRPGSSAITDPVMTTAEGVGVQLAPRDFTVYPITLGVQLATPSRLRRDFMLFAGIEGTANFVSGDLPMDQSVKPGAAFTAGFAVKVFELGIRYETFSDIQNLGVCIAFRLNPFELDFSGAE